MQLIAIFFCLLFFSPFIRYFYTHDQRRESIFRIRFRTHSSDIPTKLSTPVRFQTLKYHMIHIVPFILFINNEIQIHDYIVIFSHRLETPGPSSFAFILFHEHVILYFEQFSLSILIDKVEGTRKSTSL